MWSWIIYCRFFEVLGKSHAGLWFACRLVVVFYVACRERAVGHESFVDAGVEHEFFVDAGSLRDTDAEHELL